MITIPQRINKKKTVKKLKPIIFGITMIFLLIVILLILLQAKITTKNSPRNPIIPTQSIIPTILPSVIKVIPTTIKKSTSSGLLEYKNDVHQISFQYPSGWNIETNADDAGSQITVSQNQYSIGFYTGISDIQLCIYPDTTDAKLLNATQAKISITAYHEIKNTSSTYRYSVSESNGDGDSIYYNICQLSSDKGIYNTKYFSQKIPGNGWAYFNIPQDNPLPENLTALEKILLSVKTL
ncbi:MAG: hypothetical protein WCJ58_07035 [bacterium]